MLSEQNNKPKVALITGAARRVGREIAQYFHARAYSIIIHYNNSHKEAHELAEELNFVRADSAKLVQFDLADVVDKSKASYIHQQVMSCYNQLDVLVNSASSFFATQFGEVSLDMWRDLMISNAGGPFFLAQCLLADLKLSKGCIVNISDIHAERPLRNYSVYSIAKAANNMVTKTLAKELGPHIRVNAVAPGPVIWPENGNEISDDIKQRLIDKSLLKKAGNPTEVAKAVFFLAESDYITGQILAVDGGRSVNS